jgi:SAM-dependent methyltransferase
MHQLKRFWLVARRRGLRFIYLNLTQRVLFDLRHGTDTTKPLAKTHYESQPTGFDGGNEYSGAFTSEIIWAFRQLHRRLGSQFKDYFFADVGCGKGKVLIVWNKQLQATETVQRTLGIEYYKPLIEVAVSNHVKVHGIKPEVHHADAGEFNYAAIGRRGIFFLYNPFDAQIMAAFTAAVRDVDAYVIYNNPQHAAVLLQAGFTELMRKVGPHLNENSIVFYREAKLS